MTNEELHKLLENFGVTIVTDKETKFPIFLLPRKHIITYQLIGYNSDEAKYWTKIKTLIKPVKPVTYSVVATPTTIKSQQYYSRKRINPDRLSWEKPCRKSDHVLNGQSYRANNICLLCLDSFVDITVDSVEDFALGKITRRDLGL